MRNMMTYLLYIEYQNFTRSQIRKYKLPVILLVQQKNCITMTTSFKFVYSQQDCNHTVTQNIHVVISNKLGYRKPLKTYKDILDDVNSGSFKKISSILTFYFSTLCNTYHSTWKFKKKLERNYSQKW